MTQETVTAAAFRIRPPTVFRTSSEPEGRTQPNVPRVARPGGYITCAASWRAQEKGGAEGTAKFREETSKKAENRFGNRLAATQKVGQQSCWCNPYPAVQHRNCCGQVCDSALPPRQDVPSL